MMTRICTAPTPLPVDDTLAKRTVRLKTVELLASGLGNRLEGHRPSGLVTTNKVAGCIIS